MQSTRMTAVVAAVAAAVTAALVAGSPPPAPRPSAAPPPTAPAPTSGSFGMGDAAGTGTLVTPTSTLYRLSYVTPRSGRRLLARWNPCQNITYMVNLASVPSARRAAVLALTRKAFARTAAQTGLTFSYRGATSLVPTQGSTTTRQPAEIVVAWTSPSRTTFPLAGATAGWGGASGQWWTTGSGATSTESAALTRGYIVLDAPDALSSGVWRQGFGTGVTTGNLVMHELSHVLGLQHVSATTQLMNPMTTSRTPDGFGSGDKAGLTRVGRGAGCIRVPSGVVTDLR